MPNYNPKQSDDFKAKQFKKTVGEEELGKVIGIRLPKSLDAMVRALPNKAEWIRDAIREKAERENRAKRFCDVNPNPEDYFPELKDQGK